MCMSLISTGTHCQTPQSVHAFQVVVCFILFNEPSELHLIRQQPFLILEILQDKTHDPRVWFLFNWVIRKGQLILQQPFLIEILQQEPIREILQPGTHVPTWASHPSTTLSHTRYPATWNHSAFWNPYERSSNRELMIQHGYGFCSCCFLSCKQPFSY